MSELVYEGRLRFYYTTIKVRNKVPPGSLGTEVF